jgi:hypothetical protein
VKGVFGLATPGGGFFRWHPRFAFVLHAPPFGVLAFAPASA